MSWGRKFLAWLGVALWVGAALSGALATVAHGWSLCTSTVTRTTESARVPESAHVTEVVQEDCGPPSLFAGYPLALLSVGAVLILVGTLPVIRKFTAENIRAELNILGQKITADIRRQNIASVSPAVVGREEELLKQMIDDFDDELGG